MKIKKLNIKSCEILCIPILYFNEEKTWGVLSLDSAKSGDAFNQDHFARKLEEIIEHYKVIFIEGEKQ